MHEINWRKARVAVNLVESELVRAVEKHAPMHSPHEAYAVILEEVDEYWLEVKRSRQIKEQMRCELVQVAAMAVRAIHDLNLLEDQ